jgi:NADH:ubiquinone oxidoreductase subunit 6 (subunit J)
VIVAITIGLLSFFVLMFLGIALAWWLGDILENRTAGFLLGAAFFLLAIVIVALLRKQIISPIRNFIIRKIYD